MFEGLLFTIAGGIVLICVLACIYYVIILPSRNLRFQELLENQDFDNAELLLKDILKREPNNIQAMYDLAELYWKTNKLYDAITSYEQLLLKKLPTPMLNSINFRLACWHKEEQQYPLAQEKLELLLEKDPNNIEYLSIIADIYFEMNNFNDAAKIYKKTLALEKNNATAWKRLGDCYFKRKMYLDAYKAYAYAVNIDVKDPELWYQIAESCFLTEDYDKALSFYIKTEHFTDSYYSFQATIKISQIYKMKNMRSLYVQYLEKARLIIQERGFLPFKKEDTLEVYYQLGDFYLHDQHIELALNEWETLLKIDPKYKDTSEKFNRYYSARINDFFKDILTSQGEILTEILVEFVKNQGFTIDSIQYFGEEAIDFYVSESSSKWRNSKRKKQIISFWCIDEPMPHDIVTRLSGKLNTNDITQIYIISAGPILSETRNFLSRKSVSIFDQNNLQEFIHARKQISNT